MLKIVPRPYKCLTRGFSENANELQKKFILIDTVVALSFSRVCFAIIKKTTIKIKKLPPQCKTKLSTRKYSLY